MTEMITTLTTLFTAFFGWIGDVLELFVTTPILMVMLGLTIFGWIVGYAKRLLHS